MKVAVAIGHSRPGDMGATSAGGVSEWTYNREVGEMLCKSLILCGVEVAFFDRYEGRNYSTAMRWLADQVNAFGPDCAVELHFNAANKTAEGFEYLHWQSSSASKRLATALHDAHKASLGGISRGVKGKSAGDRGSMFLSKPACPSVITEPFFGDNPAEWDEFSGDASKRSLAETYADGILDFLGLVRSQPQPEDCVGADSPTIPSEPTPDIASLLKRVESAEWQLQQIRKELKRGSDT